MTEMVRTRAHDLALALRHYLAGEEEVARLRAYEVARDAMAGGVGVLEIAAQYQEALAILLSGPLPPDRFAEATKASAELLAESLGPFEMAHRGFQEANATLLQLNADLEQQIKERERAESAARVASEGLEHANGQLEDHVRMLREANSELEAFSYSVSHDLRAPLRAMDGFSRILLEDHAGTLSEDGQRYLRMVRGAAGEMGQLVDDLLAFSRLGRKPLSRQRVETAEVARLALGDLFAERAQRGVEVVIDHLPAADVDPALLRQVFVNLLANALKFTRVREVARVQVGWRDGDAPAYFVRDNGVGFDPQYSDKLFGVFQRLHRAEEYEGTGVGLAIVQRIIHRHGGEIWAESTIDGGATFYFTLGGKDGHDKHQMSLRW